MPLLYVRKSRTNIRTTRKKCVTQTIFVRKKWGNVPFNSRKCLFLNRIFSCIMGLRAFLLYNNF